MTNEPADEGNGWSAGWLERSRRRVAGAALGTRVESLGRVTSVADGVARIDGLPDALLDELLTFEGGQRAFVRALDEDGLAAVLLDPPEGVEAGATVRGSGRAVRVPVGDALLGRTVDPLGRPLDGKGPVGNTMTMPAERLPPGIIERAPVTEPIVTGALVVDALFALGRGQRELLVGDRATGKSSLALDAIVAQRDTDVLAVLVCIGQRTGDVERALATIRAGGVVERCIVVVAGPADPPGLQWLAPFAATTMAEHFRDAGRHVLIVHDDLTRHAATHRELALLAGEAPGREAYPGDIFYLHARLLERAAKLSPEAGGGSLTALPIAETDAGNLSAYIPTNLISITDGQLVFDARLFAAGHRPAIDVGTSVSRIGGKAQSPTLKRLSGRVRLDYAQFLELEAFTRFGALVDERARARAARGEAIRALLVQPRSRPLRAVDEIALLAGLADGALDGLAADAVATLRERLPAALDRDAPEAVRAAGEGGAPAQEALDALAHAVRALADGLRTP